MATKSLPWVSKLYNMPKPNVFSRGVPSRLPEAYKKFYEEWNAEPSPVHFLPEEGKWKRDPLTGEVRPVQNVPLPLKFPLEAHRGIWGGEAVVLGNKKRKHWFDNDCPSWWIPTLHKSVVFTEILDKRLSVVVTKRTINLIIDHHGFDNYILETSTCDLKSLLALKLKKKMLLALFDKTLYPENPEKQEAVYNKYKHHLANYNREELEWYALSLYEAVRKLLDMEDAVKPQPLKHQFRAELIEELKALAENQELDKFVKSDKEQKGSWISRINPFVKKS